MVQDSSPPHPLTMGNIVTIAVQLYRNNLSKYVPISFLATCWVISPWVVLLGIVLFFVAVQRYYGLLGILIPAWLVLLVFCIAKYLTNAALISRLAYRDLTGEPEALRDARRYTRSRQWNFFLAGTLVSMIFSGILFAFYMVFTALVVFLMFAIGGVGMMGRGAPPESYGAASGLFAFVGLLVLILLAVFVVFYLWFYARFWLVEVPLALEPDVSAVQTIGRSWTLTTQNAWRIVMILILAFTVSFPLQLLIQLASQRTDLISQWFFPVSSPAFIIFTFITSLVSAYVLNCAVLPLWQILKAVVYYDLRARREGVGLQLRDYATAISDSDPSLVPFDDDGNIIDRK